MVHVRPRRVAPEPLATTTSPPSGLQAGLVYSPPFWVRRSGAPPLALTLHTCPASCSSQLVNATQAPSGDHAGAYSCGSNESRVSRRAVPRGRSCIQSFPTAWKTSLLPSGDAVAHRMNFISNGSSETR